MNPILKNILAVILGIFVGGFVNMGLVNLGHSMLPIDGLDPKDMDAYAALVPTLECKYFIFPFLAHALGTLAGGLVVALIAANNKMKLAIGVGAFFMLGGIVAVYWLNSPIWFAALDLIIAYLPMAWIAAKIGRKLF
ncbi:MAG: hypothetical protein ACI8XB_000512 [Patiriisocius sp.]|jgi:hypothetical protein